ncbi:GntR family transcriptional regulator [Ornithinimicrobium sufpigmenti]|uniref:GntR family transcriptional regulator n=1 Tax=Ornithinimicrobium sufpigmenti TaxID=2508882 RepID=UPI0015E18C96|nr:MULTISPECIES: GntR family transcriptional regulator [unclassified Ornithinimicrobium]
MLVVDPASSEPPFEQLRRQLTEQIRGGQLAPGDRLPTVRRLAGDLGIAPNTVARAYRELEAAGLIEGRGRAGTFVSTRVSAGELADGTAHPARPDTPYTPEIRDPALLAAARRAADSYARQVRDLGLSPADALALARISLRG